MKITLMFVVSNQSFTTKLKVMLVEVTKSFTHSCNTTNKSSYSEQELQDLMLQLMQRNGIESDKAQLSPNGVLQVDEKANLKLHGIMLQAEQMGLKLKYTKKTLIEIC
ncbi:hypothetical protein [Neolewinella persica]|uniref:hypothetical protein n=1 Tax=Neolewinella persica TaxID=70998 RepID=UPI0012FBB123|nr:hypothetical protein [Neolewinella persica]